MDYRSESDSLGSVNVPKNKLWGAQTQRSLLNFKIGPAASMPFEIIKAFALIKKATAITNAELRILSSVKKDLIVTVCDEIITGKLNEHFPLVIWQTGSGTHTNMNCNEVIVNRAKQLSDKVTLHPNDDVNKSQSSNDTFSAAMNIAASEKITARLIPSLSVLKDSFDMKAKEFAQLVKTGRTHMMDAVPITLGQEFSGYSAQLELGIKALQDSLTELLVLPLGGTAIGTGINTPEGFDEKVVDQLNWLTSLSYKVAKNKFAGIAAHDAIVRSHAAIKQVAVSLMKIANDIRLMASGPRTGLAELKIPANEAGSSIMPGKINPTQIEALTMVCAQIMGNDVTISIANSNGQFELNVYKPVIIANFLQSATLLADACDSFLKNCLIDIKPDIEKINYYTKNSLMLVTVLTSHIGYEKSAQIAIKAHRENLSLKDAAVQMGFVTAEQFDKWVIAKDMTKPNLYLTF